MYDTNPYDSTLITRSCVIKWRHEDLLDDHEVPLLMSPVMQAMGWRIVHTWVRLHVYEYSKKAVQELTGYQKGCPSPL